jgi:LuxR family maltose regulon positive regulatory protein
MSATAKKTERQAQGGSAPLLMTKLHPPPLREQTVARQRLVERLRPQAGVKLTVVAAPAGCGKTTLLGAWREAEASRRPVAWVTIDDGDNDAVVLWSHILEALGRVCPSLSLSPSPNVIGNARIVGTLLPRVVNELVEQGDVALILDDFHRLSSGLSHDSIEWLVDHAPSTFQLVLGTRSEPALALAALRAHGELVEIRADELGFTPGEADELLNGSLELGLTLDEIDVLVERTEGWPAGLYLAGLSLGGVQDREAFVSTFGGSSRHVIDFLAAEMLEAHDPATQALILRSSILDRLCGPLCDAVVEREGSRILLEALSQKNLFLIPLDDRGTWYRFHHIFAQLLRVELEHREPGLAVTLHRRAFEWHRDNGSIAAAIEHALEAGAFVESAELITSAWIDDTYFAHHMTVLRWLERLPTDLLRENAELLLVRAWVLSLSGEQEAAASAITALEDGGPLDAGPLPDGFSSLEASLATLRATFPWGDFGAGVENGRRAAELEGPSSPWRPLVCHSLGACLYVSGEFEEADLWLEQSTAPALEREQWRVAVSSLAYRSLVAGELGRPDEQELLAEAALQLAQEHGLEEVEGEVFVALGASLVTRRALEQALIAFERGAAVLRPLRHPRGLADALIRQASALQALGRRAAAGRAIDEARAIVASCPDPRLLGERLASVERPQPVRRRARNGALSARELVILRMLGGPLSERDIGRELYLSYNTIHSHTKSIYRKLRVSSRSEAIHHARELGLI